jgi:hypothetical protein
MEEQKEITKDFIQEKYMQLLEESYINDQEKSSSKLKKIIFFSSTTFALFFMVFFIYKPSINKALFSSNLTETIYNPATVLLENNLGKLYKIPVNNKSWITETGISITIDSNKIKLTSIEHKNYSQFFKIHTPKNKQYKLILPDLSKITINKNSVITVNLFSEKTIPNIILKGEAFFNIAKQTIGTFNILANNMNIEVVGTEFNVSNYTDLEFTQLSLVEGKVKINNKKKTTVINAGQQATMYRGKPNLLVENKDFSDALAWLHDNIYFENKPLIDISKIIENWYDVKFIFSNSKLKNMHFTGTLEKEKGLTHFLQMLKYTEGLKYTINQKTITLNYK